MEIWDVRKGSSSTGPNLLRSLKTPVESGPISCVVAFPDGRHIATCVGSFHIIQHDSLTKMCDRASQDNIRLWNAAEVFYSEDSAKRSKGKTPFKIIAGHHGGTISSMSTYLPFINLSRRFADVTLLVPLLTVRVGS